ncbi:MAG: hypothetical protein ACRD63_10385 [Pyrinomonadaceae bacterium]
MTGRINLPAIPQAVLTVVCTLIDDKTAVLVCSGSSLDRLSPVAWAEIQRAGAVVSINTALAARACSINHISFTYAAALDGGLGETSLDGKVPGFDQLWAKTPAWRVTSDGPNRAEAESYVIKVLDGWSDDPNGGFAGGSKGMVLGNWVTNDWPGDAQVMEELSSISMRTGKKIPSRGFRKLAYVGLDMHRGQGQHAAGSGAHLSGFCDNPERDQLVRNNWGRFCRAAKERGIELVNLSPGSGLEAVPRVEVPTDWLLD